MQKHLTIVDKCCILILSNKKEYHEKKAIIVADLEIESKTTIRSNRIYFDEGKCMGFVAT